MPSQSQPQALAEWAAPLFSPHRYKVLYGGRGSGKTWAVAAALIIQAAQKRLRIVCVRETQNSIQESAKRTLETWIERLGLTSFYRVTEHQIRGANGSLFFFRGMSTSTEDAVRGWESVDIVWCEEAQRLSQRSREILFPTIRKEGSELWFTFNPRFRTDPVYRDFVTNKRPDAWVQKVNFDANPWFPSVLEEERQITLEQEPERYGHIWLGEPDDEADAVLRLISSVRVELAFDEYRPEYAAGLPMAGLDVADSAAGDWNAFCVRVGPVVTHLERWRAPDTGVTAQRAHQRCLAHGVEVLSYDVGGVGSGVKAAMAQIQPEYLVRPVHFGGAVRSPDKTFVREVTNKDFFRNRKSQLGWALRLRTRKLARNKKKPDSFLPEDCFYIDPDALKRVDKTLVIDELSRAAWEEDASGRVVIVKDPDELGSPDMFDAVSLAFQTDSRFGLKER